MTSLHELPERTRPSAPNSGGHLPPNLRPLDDRQSEVGISRLKDGPEPLSPRPR